MKCGFSVLLVTALLSSIALAQDFVAPVQPRREIRPPAPRPVTPLDPDSAIEGAVAAAFQTRQPWQLVNPLAPKGYGDGRYLTSWNPNDEGKPKGFILFGIRFW
ncbi:MAG: hypothetical protein RIQ71_168 [Verrucomicrobiota bacterium]|jgi:hypothetical protein